MVLLFSRTPRLALGPTQDPSVGTKVNKPACVSDHTLPTNANVNKWNYTSICCHGLHRHDVTFTLNLRLLILFVHPICIFLH